MRRESLATGIYLAQSLPRSYWRYVRPQWAMLDPKLHTFAFLRSRSALLTTTILALGSTALATLPQKTAEEVEEALSLHAHVERAHLVVFTTYARSIEIMQAQIVRFLTLKC